VPLIHIRVIKMRIRYVGHVTHTEETEKERKILVENQKRLGDLDIDGRITLKWIKRKI
jgi:hypothetical protein